MSEGEPDFGEVLKKASDGVSEKENREIPNLWRKGGWYGVGVYCIVYLFSGLWIKRFVWEVGDGGAWKVGPGSCVSY